MSSILIEGNTYLAIAQLVERWTVVVLSNEAKSYPSVTGSIPVREILIFLFPGCYITHPESRARDLYGTMHGHTNHRWMGRQLTEILLFLPCHFTLYLYLEVGREHRHMEIL